MSQRRIAWFLSILLLLAPLTGCVDIPSDYSLDLNVDTGQNLMDLMQATMADLQRAEQIAGEEARATIQEAIAQLTQYMRDVDAIIGTRLEMLINQLDAAIQAKLLWIQNYTEQVHGYALDIIHATGEEARATIREATNGMRRTINETELALQRSTIVLTRNLVFLVDRATDRALTFGGLIAGLLLTFICAFGWGKLIYQQRFPEGARRTMAFGLLLFSFLFALAPLSLLFAPVRAYALTPAGKATVLEMPVGRPSVYQFLPDPIILPFRAPTPPRLSFEGANLAAYGQPTVTFGNRALGIIGQTEDKIEVDLSSLGSGAGGNRVDVVFASGTAVVRYAVPVWTAVPTPRPIRVPNVTGMNETQATQAISGAGLVVGSKSTEGHDTLAAGLVIRTSPVANAEVAPGARVSLVLSSGPRKTRVPLVVGMTVAQARDALTARELRLGTVTYEIHPTINKDLIFGSTPSNNSEVNVGSAVAVVVSRGRACQKPVPEFRPSALTLAPPHTRGDREFDGNGPDVNIRVTLYLQNNTLRARIYMKAVETKDDWTTAEGQMDVEIYRPNPGFRLTQLIGQATAVQDYRDSDHEQDEFRPGGPVSRLLVMGDTGGDDAGTDTKVTVEFNMLRVQLVEIGECVE